ncbi:MAG: amino acid permease [Deltaproteobacteria bacterium]|jgi:amino acid transporter|nr:amino acid permease [Deltaproteobacteria bacterium]MBW2534168.1 amino acid permease [Deltaproteobacteria bacterium]
MRAAIVASCEPSMSSPDQAHLKRSLSLLDVMALGVNAVIGQGIFLLPGLAAALLGPASLVSLLFAAAIAMLIALCFAEVGSRFRSTGGAYVYARETFGSFVGFEVGWMLCCVGIISWAALANGFTVVLARFVPAVGEGWLQPVTAIGLMALLGGLNLKGAKMGATVSTFFSIAKLVPVVLFVAIGLFHMEGALYEPFAPQGYAKLAEGTLLMLYAFVGFESSVVPAGEMKNPQKAVPKALMTVMAVVCAAYLLVFVVTIGTFPDVAGHGNPVAAASERFLGPIGGLLIAGGIVVSVFGINAGAALVSPRKVYALAEKGDLPRIVARIDPKTGTPRVAILVTLVAAAGLSLTGSVKDLAILGVLARFVQYIPTCLAVIVLRRRDDKPVEGFRVPFGPVIPIVAIGLCGWLIINTEQNKLIAGAIALAAGVPFYFLAQRRKRKAA